MRATIISRIYRPEPAAASFYLGAVADSLIGAGHAVDVVTVMPKPGTALTPKGERIRTFPVLRDRGGYVRGYFQYLSFDVPLLFRALFMRRPDAVFVEPPPTTGAIVRLVCGIRRIPYVYDAADIWSDAASFSTDSGLVIRVVRWLERFAMRGAAHLVTISEGVVSRVQDLGVDTPITVTGFGADTEEFFYSDEAISPVFLYAGTYSGLHGVDILIDAFATFLAEHPGYTLRFVGNGTERASLEARAAARGITDSVEFLDPVPAAELRAQLAGATASLATLLPGGGYDYAFTSKVYSSLAVGCPVIFSGPGPTRSFVETANAQVAAGFAVDYDAPEIAAAMSSLVAQAPSAQDRRAVADWTEAEHSLRAVANRVTRVMGSVAKTRRAKR